MADLATEGSRTAPIDGSALEPIVRYAAMAPSSHNTQPWRFEVSDARIDVLADRSRALPVGDPDDRELTISCGCAVFNLRVAAAHAGFASTTHILPDPDDPDRLARVTLEPCATSLPEAELFSAIERRHTYRRIFERRPVSPPLRFELIEAAQAEGAWLAILQTDEAREGIATLVAQGDVAQWADASWRRELATWMHPRARGDGLAVPAIAAPVAHVVVRRLDLGRRMGAKDEALAIDSPLLAVLGTTHDDPVDWVDRKSVV